VCVSLLADWPQTNQKKKKKKEKCVFFLFIFPTLKRANIIPFDIHRVVGWVGSGSSDLRLRLYWEMPARFNLGKISAQRK
jgi:hypothetical protein